MRRRRWFIAASTPGLLLLTCVALCQETVIRVNVDLVRVLATVKDTVGELVGTLEKQDFSISDNGVPQEIAVFERRTDQPLSVALLVDTSLSTAKELRYETDSVARFLKAFFAEGNLSDAVALYSFNYVVTKMSHFTISFPRLDQSLKSLRPEGGTSLYDAIYLSSGELESRRGRKIIVIVTDGGDTTSVKDFHAALQAAHLADAVIYSILVMPITNDAGRNIGGENALATFAAGTGGRVFAPSFGESLDRAFADILKELRTQYLLAYYPRNVAPTKNRFHRLEVRVNRSELQVLARNGYYGEAEPVPGLPGGKVPAGPGKPYGR